MTNPTLSPSPIPSSGTLPDLLLAFAVNRHGTSAWDSIASELRNRTDDPSLSLTPQNCRLKYLDLKRRFNHDFHDDSLAAASLLEELRNLRVAELRREVQRYDLNIQLLEMKVKKMEEERERSVREESESDLEKKSDRVQPESEAATVGEPAAGEDLEKDQLSVNESNSTDLRAKKLRTAEKDPEPVHAEEDDATQNQTGQVSDEPSELKSESDRKPGREDSCNGSSNSIKKSNRKPKPSCLAEPDTESGGEEEEAPVAKESSDVQSTASRSRKEVEKNKVRRGSRGGEREDQSRAVKPMSVESQPLGEFLRSICAQKFGSVFQRRLRSQETSKYEKLILQHMDLETVETRLKEGWYSGGSSTKFFRDLLLLVNNALIFFAKKSAEAKAANDFRQFVMKEIVSQKQRKPMVTRKQVLLQSLSMSKKEAPDPTDCVALKPRPSGPIVVCHNRTLITRKRSAADKKKEQQQDKDTEEYHSEDSESSEDEPRVSKRRRDCFTSTRASTRINSKNQSNNNSVQQGKGGGSTPSSQRSESKNNTKKNQSTTLDSSKKRGAANFLNRMKQGSGSPPNNDNTLLDALKNRSLTSESATSRRGSSSEQKKNENIKKREGPSRRNTTETKEKDSPGKRNVGRPPKRLAAMSGKRSREKAEIESPPAKQQPKKRSRKL